MKKLFVTLLSFVLALTIVGCNSSKKVDEDAKNNKPRVEEENKNEKELPPVTIEELPLDVTILEPNSSGTVYMQATFTNNSKYAITGFNVTILLKDENEKTYLSNYDTVLSGETSSKFESFGPSTGNLDDVEYLKYEITLTDDNGKDIYLDYDVKLKTYEWI